MPLWAGEDREDLAAWELGTSARKVENAAKNSCQICELLHSGLLTLIPNLEDEAIVIIFCPGDVLRLQVGNIDGEATNRGKGAHPIEVEFYTQSEGGRQWKGIGSNMVDHQPRKRQVTTGGTARSIPLQSSSVESWTTILEWIEDCGQNHFLCGSQSSFIRMPITNSQTLPRRVVDIGEKHDNSQIRIFETNSCGGTYLALSHAWGDHLPLLTTKESLAQFKKNISWSSLSITFQDAIYITRQLGVRHLWIDTLCIIQDDKRDWEIEGSNMAAIYSDAILVLSATLSRDGTGGCFCDRQTSHELNTIGEDGSEFTVFVRQRLQHIAFNMKANSQSNEEKSIKYIEANLADLPVLQRAWCYQERLLSRRTLHYTKTELVWECVQATHCECGTLYYNSDNNNTIRRRMNTTRFDRNDTNHPFNRVVGRERNPNPWYLPEDWNTIIQQYAYKRLGFATDTLPALAGLASRIGSGDGKYLGKYLAGLWEKDLGDYLAWVPLSKDIVRPRDKAQVTFPSWTWASVDTPFGWLSFGPKGKTLLCFAVLGNDYEMPYEQPSNMGDKDCASDILRLVSDLLIGSKSRDDAMDEIAAFMPRMNYAKWSSGSIKLRGQYVEATLKSMDDSRDVNAAFLEREGIQYSFVVDRLSQCKKLIGSLVYIMRISQVEDPDPMKKDGTEQKLPASIAFVLIRVQEKDNTFERIGMLQGFPTKWYDGEEFRDFDLA